jgi:hypothetical protein
MHFPMAAKRREPCSFLPSPWLYNTYSVRGQFLAAYSLTELPHGRIYQLLRHWSVEWCHHTPKSGNPNTWRHITALVRRDNGPCNGNKAMHCILQQTNMRVHPMGFTALHFVSDWHDPILRGLDPSMLGLEECPRAGSTSRVREQGIAKMSRYLSRLRT